MRTKIGQVINYISTHYKETYRTKKRFSQYIIIICSKESFLVSPKSAFSLCLFLYMDFISQSKTIINCLLENPTFSNAANNNSFLLNQTLV